MTDLQIIRSPSGDELVVIPKAEYEGLVAAASFSAEERHRMTLEALADVDAGRVVDHTDVEAWGDRLGTDHPLPVPTPP